MSVPTGMALFFGSEEGLPVALLSMPADACCNGHGLLLLSGGVAHPLPNDAQDCPLLRTQDRTKLIPQTSVIVCLLFPGLS